MVPLGLDNWYAKTDEETKSGYLLVYISLYIGDNSYYLCYQVMIIFEKGKMCYQVVSDEDCYIWYVLVEEC